MITGHGSYFYSVHASELPSSVSSSVSGSARTRLTTGVLQLLTAVRPVTDLPVSMATGLAQNPQLQVPSVEDEHRTESATEVAI